LVVSLVFYRGFHWTQTLRVIADGVRSAAVIMLIVAAALAFGHWMTESGVPAEFVRFAAGHDFATWQFLLLINLLLLVLGCFLEVAATLLLVLPILAPVLKPLGVDPVHFAIIFTHNMEIGLVHPPVGLNLFVMSTISAPSLLAHATRDLAEFAARTVYDDIPPAVIERVKLSFMDGLGACLHGATLPWTQRVRDVVQEEGGSPVASLWGSGTRTSVTGAVLVNSTAGHGFEMDDIHKESVIHPNSLAVPVALALAEADRTLTGRDIVTAVTLGYEVGLRIGNAATTSLLLNGFHPQGTTGAFVAAAIAGRLLKLDPEQMQNALGIAGSLGAGLTAAQEGAMVKRLHAGRAAQSGLLGALLAKRGFTGIPNVVEASSGGFLSAFSRTPN